MKRIKSKAFLVKKRIKKVQRKAKWTGILYLIGTIVLAAFGLMFNMIDNSAVAGESGSMPIMNVINGFSALSADGKLAQLTTSHFVFLEVVALAIYLVMALVLVVNVFRAFGKLGWLFKRRASYANGFNRNAYAMDDISKRFSSSLFWLIAGNLLLFLLPYPSDVNQVADKAVSSMGLIALIAGLAMRVLFGLSEGKVTLFTTGDKVEEEAREFGMGAFFLRSLVQIVIGFAVVYLLAPLTNFGGNGVLGKLIAETPDTAAALELTSLVPFAVEAIVWLFVLALIKRITSATEFNRDGMEAAGIKKFRVLSIFTALFVVVFAVLPMIGFGAAEAGLNTGLLIVAAVAIVGAIIDGAVKPSYHDNKDDLEMAMDQYFVVSDEMARYNNTII